MSELNEIKKMLASIQSRMNRIENGSESKGRFYIYYDARNYYCVKERRTGQQFTQFNAAYFGENEAREAAEIVCRRLNEFDFFAYNNEFEKEEMK